MNGKIKAGQQARCGVRRFCFVIAFVAFCVFLAPLQRLEAAEPVIKWHPGLYPEGNFVIAKELDADAWSSVEDWIAARGTANEPLNSGVHIVITWGVLEPTQGNYSAAYSIIDRLLGLCESAGLRLSVHTWDRSFETSPNLPSTPQTDTTPGLPDWLIDAGGAQVYTPYQGFSVLLAKTWVSQYMDPWIALHKALGDRYNSHPRFERIEPAETAPVDTDPSWSVNGFYTQQQRFVEEVGPHWANTPKTYHINFFGEFMDSQAKLNRARALVEAAVASGWGLSSPDMLPESLGRQPTDGELIIRGGTHNFYGNFLDFGPGYLGQVPISVHNEGFSLELDRAGVFDYSLNTVRNTHLTWAVAYDFDGADAAHRWEGSEGVYAYLASQPSVIYSTDCPANFTCEAGGEEENNAADDFNRGNGGLGGNWTTAAVSSAPLQVMGNQAQVSAGNYAESLYTAVSFGEAQFSEVQHVIGLGSGVINLVTRARQYTGAGAGDGYIGQLNGLGNSWRIIRVTDQVETEIATGPLSYANGDTFYFEAVGATLTLKKNGLTLGVASDATYTSGDAGFGVYNAGSLVVDNWRGGDVVATVHTDEDNFNRANGSLGGSWTVSANSSAPLQIIGNQAQVQSANYGESLYTAAPSASSQFSEIQYIGGLGTSVINLVTRARQYSSAGTVDGYIGQINGFDNTWRIIRVDDQSETAIAAGTLSYSSGDTFYFEADGTVLTLKINGVQLGTANDSTYASGVAGFGLYSSSGSLTVDNWRGGQP